MTAEGSYAASLDHAVWFHRPFDPDQWHRYEVRPLNVGDARGLVLVEVEGPADEIPLTPPVGVELRWLHRGAAAPGSALLAALRALEPPTGPVSVFAHGERGAMKEARVVLHDTWGLDRAGLSLSAYWALGRVEDRFQAEKREPVGAIFAD